MFCEKVGLTGCAQCGSVRVQTTAGVGKGHLLWGGGGFWNPRAYRVATASEGEEALRYVSHGTPVLVLLDLKMPGMNGVEFLRRFREEHADIPVMVITGYADSDLMAQAMRCGPVTLLAKPVAKTVLLRAVYVALKGSLARERTT